jgi:hypothetical protein
MTLPFFFTLSTSNPQLQNFSELFLCSVTNSSADSEIKKISLSSRKIVFFILQIHTTFQSVIFKKNIEL